MQYTFKSSLIIISFYEICSNVQEYFRMNFDKCDGFGEKIKTELKNFMGKKTNIIDKNKPNNLLLLFCKDFEATQSKMSSFYFILYNFTLENVEIFKVNIENITAISLKIFDNKENFQNLIIAFGTYEGSIHIAYGSKSSELELYQNHVKKIDKIHNYKINCLDFSFIPSSEFILMASGSNDRKIIITSISFKEQQKILIINTVYKYV